MKFDWAHLHLVLLINPVNKHYSAPDSKFAAGLL